MYVHRLMVVIPFHNQELFVLSYTFFFQLLIRRLQISFIWKFSPFNPIDFDYLLRDYSYVC